MKLSDFNWFSALFLLLFVALSVAHSESLADMDLAPRLLVLCVINVTGLIVFLKSRTTINGVFNVVLKSKLFIITLLWMVVVGLGYFQSINKSDASFEVLKLSTIFSLFLWVTVCIVNGNLSLKTIGIASMVASLITVLFTLVNIYNVYEFCIYNKQPFQITYTIFGNHCNKNTLAEFLLLTLPFTSLLIKDGNRKIKLASIITVLLCTILIFVLKSASVIISFAIGFGIFASLLLIKHFSLKPKTIAITVLVFALSLFTFLYTNNTVRTRLTLLYNYAFTNNAEINNNNSTFERLLLWKNSLQIIKDNPLVGAGLCNWKILFPKYGYSGAKYLVGDSIKFTRPHNDYLQYWSENGIAGMLLYIAIFVFALWLLLKGVLKQDRQDFYLISLISAGIIFYSLISLFGYTSERPFNLVMLMLLVAITISLSKKPNPSKIKNPKLLVMSAFILICVNCLGLVIFKDRIKNELLLNIYLTHQKEKNHREMLDIANKIDANNFPIDYTATPINWYKATSNFVNNKTETARDYYMKAVNEAPYHVQVITDAGVVSEKSGELAKAEEFYKRALSINKDFPQAKLNLAALKYNQGKVTEAYNALTGFMPKSIAKTSYEKMIEFKKVFLVALADSALYSMKQSGQPHPPKEKIFYQDLLKADSLSAFNNAPITENLIKVFSAIK